MAVDSPVEGAAPVCPAEGSPVGDPTPVKAALLTPKATEAMTTTVAQVAVAAAATTCTQQEGSAAPCSPLSTPQQNGEVSPESSQPSASPQPSSPLATPPPAPGSAHGGDTMTQESPATVAAPVQPQEKSEEVTETPATTTAAATGKDEALGNTEGGVGCGSETQGTQTTPAQTPTPGTPAPPTPTPPAHTQPQPLTRDQIKQLVAQQVEYFFSRSVLSLL